MITFKQFIGQHLLEKTLISKPWEVKKLKTKDAIEYLNNNCKDGLKAIASNGVIYRSFGKAPGKAGKMLELDSSSSVRTSRDTNNLYQLMFDTSKSMSDVPSRSSSFICSSSLDSVNSMSNVIYAMVPLDGTTIAVCNDEDIFETSMPEYLSWKELSTVEVFGDEHADFFSCFVNKTKGKFLDAGAIDTAMAKFTPAEIMVIYDQKYESIRIATFDKQIQREFEKMRMEIDFTNLKKPEFVEQLSKFARDFIATGKYALYESQFGHKDLLKMLKAGPAKPFTTIASQIADKKKLKITTVKYGTTLPDTRECWFSGKCVAIPIDLWVDIIQQMKKQKMPLHPNVFETVSAFAELQGLE